MKKWLTIASAICYSIAITAGIAADAKTSDASLSEKIIGSWVDRKVITFLPNGTWELRKYQSAAATPGLGMELGHRTGSLSLRAARSGSPIIGAMRLAGCI